MRVWVLNWRLELEDQAQQTEEVYPELFVNKQDAVDRAVSIARKQCKYFGHPAEDFEVEGVVSDLSVMGTTMRSHLLQLTDSDNLVFELSQKAVHRHKGRK